MFSFYVLHFYFCLRAPFLERFVCIPSSPWLGFSHGFISFCFCLRSFSYWLFASFRPPIDFNPSKLGFFSNGFKRFFSNVILCFRSARLAEAFGMSIGSSPSKEKDDTGRDVQ